MKDTLGVGERNNGFDLSAEELIPTGYADSELSLPSWPPHRAHPHILRCCSSCASLWGYHVFPHVGSHTAELVCDAFCVLSVRPSQYSKRLHNLKDDICIIFIYMYICIDFCVCICFCVYIYIHICFCVHAYTYVYMCVYAFVYIHIYVYMCVCFCIYIRVYIYTCRDKLLISNYKHIFASHI